jgi:hydrogenase maturation factor
VAADIGESIAVAALALSRRFARGATLWCVAPEWPEHARHVAVEFVHPVVMGKRAFPAVSVDSADPVGALRPLVRPGDVVLAISSATSAAVTHLMPRARAWGATTMWIGVGDGPATHDADHVVCTPNDDDSPALHDGRLVLLYHVLWELTHVCFEHPGLLKSDDECVDSETCITCADEGRLGEVIDNDERGTAHVRTARGVEVVDTTIVAGVSPGDLVLIHAGTAIAEFR